MLPSLEELTKNLTPKQEEQFWGDYPDLSLFMEKYNAILVGIHENTEHHLSKGLMYHFVYDLEVYSSEGVKNSLEE
jgi:hypothetical protein